MAEEQEYKPNFPIIYNMLWESFSRIFENVLNKDDRVHRLGTFVTGLQILNQMRRSGLLSPVITEMISRDLEQLFITGEKKYGPLDYKGNRYQEALLHLKMTYESFTSQ